MSRRLARPVAPPTPAPEHVDHRAGFVAYINALPDHARPRDRAALRIRAHLYVRRHRLTPYPEQAAALASVAPSALHPPE
ncbi:MAG: hypothetical protein ACTHLH_06970 [Solirubrobacterales bacterium]